MTTLRSAFFLALSTSMLLAISPAAHAEVGLYGIGGTASVGGGRGPSTDAGYAQGNINMIHTGSIGGGVAKIGYVGGANTDDASSTGGGHANLRGIGPTASIGKSGNNATKIGGTGAGAAVPGGLGG